MSFNEALIRQGNKRALKRKIEGLDEGWFGYPEDPEQAYKINEALAQINDNDAIDRKIMGLVEGMYGSKIPI
jgi:hypothetical protein